MFYHYGNWGKCADVRNVYKYEVDKYKKFNECHWMLKKGDLFVCVEWAGDCFGLYAVMRLLGDGWYMLLGEVGLYNRDLPFDIDVPLGKLDKRQYHLLRAGEKIFYEVV